MLYHKPIIFLVFVIAGQYPHSVRLRLLLKLLLSLWILRCWNLGVLVT
jgi:hypothetical protein